MPDDDDTWIHYCLTSISLRNRDGRELEGIARDVPRGPRDHRTWHLQQTIQEFKKHLTFASIDTDAWESAVGD